jgi:hypothetical protein
MISNNSTFVYKLSLDQLIVNEHSESLLTINLQNALMKSHSENKELIIIAGLVMEDYNESLIEKCLSIFNDCLKCLHIKLHNVYIIANSHLSDSIRNFSGSIIYIDTFLLKTYGYILNGHPINDFWNYNVRKSLLLTGKANKIHRVGLLSKFYDNNLLNELEWSLFVNTEISNLIRHSILSDYDDLKFKNFIQYCTRNPDNIKIDMHPSDSHYGGFPYDVRLYSSTCLSIISETWFRCDCKPFITEKTWKTIANKHPFILAGDIGHLNKMKSLGFKTFENFMLHSEYNNVNKVDDNIRLNKIIENHTYFLNNFKNNISEINYDVEWNFQQFQKRGKIELKKITDLIIHIRYESEISEFDLFNYFII